MSNQLTEKVWYRFVQVIFGIAVTLSIVTLIVLLLNFRPRETVDLERSTFKCTDKDSENFNKSFGFKGTSVYLENDGSLPEWHESTINNWCTKGDYRYTGNGTYFEISPVFKYDYSRTKYYSYAVLSIVILCIVWLVIRKLFLYIVLGKKKN